MTSGKENKSKILTKPDFYSQTHINKTELNILKRKSVFSQDERLNLLNKMATILPLTSRCKSIWLTKNFNESKGERFLNDKKVSELGDKYEHKISTFKPRFTVLKATKKADKIIENLLIANLNQMKKKEIEDKVFGSITRRSTKNAATGRSISNIKKSSRFQMISSKLSHQLSCDKLESPTQIDVHRLSARSIKNPFHTRYLYCCNLDSKINWIHIPINWLTSCINLLEAVDDAIIWSCFDPLYKFVRNDYKEIREMFPELYPLCDMKAGFEEGTDSSFSNIRDGVERATKNETRDNDDTERIIKNECKDNDGVERIIKNKSKDNDDVERIIKNESKVNNYVESIIKNESKTSEGLEMVTKNKSKSNDGVEMVTENESKAHDGVEMVTKYKSKSNDGVEMVTKNESKAHDGVEMVTKYKSKSNDGVERNIKFVSMDNDGIEIVTKNESKDSNK